MFSQGLENFFQLSNEILLVSNWKGEILNANFTFERTFGWKLDKIRNQNFQNFIPSNELESTKLAFNELLDQKLPRTLQTQFRCFDDSYYRVNWNLCVKDGFVFYVGQIIDNQFLTEMLNTKKELLNYKTALDKSAIIALTDKKRSDQTF